MECVPNHIKLNKRTQYRRPNAWVIYGITGTVRAIGPWPKTSNGLALMPEFGIGSRVILRPTSGREMRHGTAGRFKMLYNDDVLAVLT